MLLLLNYRLQSVLKESPYFFIIRIRRENSVAIEDAPGICIHDKDRVISGVQENRVGSFRSNAVQAEQFFA